MIKSGLGLQKNYDAIDDLIPFMSSTLQFSRLTGILFALSFLNSILNRHKFTAFLNSS